MKRPSSRASMPSGVSASFVTHTVFGVGLRVLRRVEHEVEDVVGRYALYGRVLPLLITRAS